MYPVLTRQMQLSRAEIDSYFTGPRLGEGHFAVRFGDRGPRFHVWLDDKEISDRCIEVYAGRHGWAILTTCLERAHLGPCLFDVVRGNFSVVVEPDRNA